MVDEIDIKGIAILCLVHLPPVGAVIVGLHFQIGACSQNAPPAAEHIAAGEVGVLILDCRIGRRFPCDPVAFPG